jgi:ATP/maltotriose-dependent transcriptional regulator MalT
LGELLRDGEACFEHAQALHLLSDKLPAFVGLADVNAGRAFMLQGSWEEGAVSLRKGIVFHKAVGLISQLMWAKLDEAKFFASRGQFDNALAVIVDAIVDSEELAHIQSPALRQRAELLVSSGGEPSAIEAAYRFAIECARSQSAKYYELQATTPFARWLRSQGRAAEAQTLLDEIYGWFTEGFDTADLKDAKALLDELSGA